MANLKKLCIDGNCSDVLDRLDELDGVEISDLADGDILKYDANSGKWVNAEDSGGGGGGGSSVPEKDVNFIDYDGTIVYSYTKNEFLALDALPANPSHNGLTAQGWNWTLEDAKNQVGISNELIIGQMYITHDEKTRLYVHFEEARKSPYLGICPNGTVEIDWGDGSPTDTLTGASLTTVKQVQHTYANGGDYVITLTVVSGEFAFYGFPVQTVYESYILTKETNASTQYGNFAYLYALKKVELGKGVHLGSYAFAYCACLKSITIPKSVTNIGMRAFYYCLTIRCNIVPDGVTNIEEQAFSNGYTRETISIPKSVISLDASCVYNNWTLREIVIPDGVTILKNAAFSTCRFISKIVVPDTVTLIEAQAFYGCYSMAEYHFKSTIPPTLANTNAFNNIPSDCIIYVPYSADHSILNAYKTASNWSTYASYMQEEPQ